MMRFFTTISFLLLTTLSLQAQISGRISDERGESVPFANVYLQNSTRGTTANTDGFYTFDLEAGTYEIVFQSIGFQKIVQKVVLKKNEQKTLNVTLKSSELELATVTVKANAEDPAYPIIRKAIAKRSYFRDLQPDYACEVYIKGVQKIVDAPKKIFGRELGDMGGALDSSRQGIVYLSESLSKYFVSGDEKKENVISAKVSGNDNGFGFNRAVQFDFSFYRNHINIARDLLSPIAENALLYYRYRLIGTEKNKEGYDVKKIEVIPKRKDDATWAGIIYITDQLFNIQSTDLYATGRSIGQPVLDTLWLRQSFVPNNAKNPEHWSLFAQNISFKLGILGLKIRGEFSGIYTNYNFEPKFASNFFGNELFSASRGKRDKELSYWDSLRPIPLTMEERTDYIKKDSIQTVHNSKPYQDSVDRVNNRFGILDILSGYTYRNTHEKWSISYLSPTNSFNFNPIQGLALSLPFEYEKRYGKEQWHSAFRISPSVNYGFEEKIVRGKLSASYLFNRFNYAKLTLSGGQELAQHNQNEAISPAIAEVYNLWGKEHYMKLFQKTFFALKYQQEVANGLTLTAGIEQARRAMVVNNSQYSFAKKDAIYPENIPETAADNAVFAPYDATTLDLSLRWTYGLKYATYPHLKYNIGSDYPDVTFSYRKGFAPSTVGKQAVDYDQIRLRITQDNLKMGLFGNSEWAVEGGTFLNKSAVPFIDFQHFNGNQTFLGSPKNYLNNFFQLPYYRYSTTSSYAMAHYQHHFQGFFLDKIPLIRRLHFKEVVRAAYLYTPEVGYYGELSLGLEEVGWGLFRLFRVDVFTRYQDQKWNNAGLMIGVAF